MHLSGNGHPLDSGTYRLEGFSFSLAGRDGAYQLTPQCLVWPQLGSDMHNQIALEVLLSSGRFSAQVLLEGPLAMLYRLADDLDAILDGQSDQINFPSQRAIQDLMLPTLLHVYLDPISESGALMRCECGTPFLPSRFAPHMRQQIQAQRGSANLALVTAIELESLDPFRDDLRNFLRWLALEMPAADKAADNADAAAS